MTPPILYILSGLPGTGKTTVARLLASHVGAAHVRIDTIEQGLRDLCAIRVEAEGYVLAYAIARDILSAGVSVVADSCNPIESTRREWEQVARDAGARRLNIEIVCSDRDEHRRRVETRQSTVPGLRLPTWDEVVNRDYDAWTNESIVLDTANRQEKECLDSLLVNLVEFHAGPRGPADI